MTPTITLHTTWIIGLSFAPRPLMRKSAAEVAVGLATKVFPYLGLPKILQSDNGREFVNEIVKETMARSSCDN